MQTRLAGRDADRSGERSERHAAARPEHRRREPRVVVPVMQPRVRELVGEQAEAGDVAGPAPARRAQRQDRDLERIAGLCAVDPDRAGDRIDAAEVELFEVGRGRGLVELTGRGVERLELHALARRDLQHRGKGVVPAVVDVVAVDRVAVREIAHGEDS